MSKSKITEAKDESKMRNRIVHVEIDEADLDASIDALSPRDWTETSGQYGERIVECWGSDWRVHLSVRTVWTKEEEEDDDEPDGIITCARCGFQVGIEDTIEMLDGTLVCEDCCPPEGGLTKV